jgi:ATP-binding cassette, subfamily G (WHITE), member 2, SNQ2
MTAANLMPFFIIMCELFNGILQPVYEMPVFWRYTMYYVAPFTYWIGGTLGVVLRARPVTCNIDELIQFVLPSDNGTCGEYAQSFLDTASGYLANPDAAGDGTTCSYCQYSSGEDVSILHAAVIPCIANGL